jgi:hypothetical protein
MTAQASISASPLIELWPPAPATRPTPPSASRNPNHDCAVALPRPSAAAISATNAGTVARIRAECVTLVRSMPLFCSATPTP